MGEVMMRMIRDEEWDNKCEILMKNKKPIFYMNVFDVAFPISFRFEHGNRSDIIYRGIHFVILCFHFQWYKLEVDGE